MTTLYTDIPFTFNMSEDVKKQIKMPPPLIINTFGRIMLKQNFTDNDVIYYKGEDRVKLLETIFKNEKNTNFFDRMLMASVYFFVSNPFLLCPRQKFGYLETIKSNMFYSEENKRLFTGAFERAQAQYHVLLRFINKWRVSRSILRIQTDLILNPISETHRNVIAVYHHGNKYLFTIMDITKIIENALLNSTNMVSSPISIKNPYNNIPFPKSVLYNLYFQLKTRDFILSPVFHSYFLCNFNLKRFKLENEVMIRESAIARYLSASNQTTLVSEIKAMLKWYNGRCDSGFSIIINKDFPKDKLVTAMKPYLIHYLKHIYSLDLNAQYYNEYRLEDKLHEFITKFPLFGCKVKKRIEGTGRWSITFHEKGLPFKPDINMYKHYDTCHLEYESMTEDENENYEERWAHDFVSVYASESNTSRVIRHNHETNEIVNEFIGNLNPEQVVDLAFMNNDLRIRSPSTESSLRSSMSIDNEVIMDLRDGLEDGEEEDA